MKILLIGADGFIGESLYRYFVQQKYDVTATVFLRKPGKNEIYCDIADPVSVNGLPGIKYDVIINAAGIVDQKQPAKRMMAVNGHAVNHLLKFAKKYECPHFIQLSSIAVYGLRTIGLNRNEDDTPRFRGILGIPYMKSKALAERYIEKSPVPSSMIRMPAVIGAGDSFTSPSIVNMLLSGMFFFCGKGDKLVSLLYAENLGPWIDRIIEIGPLPQPMNCCDHHVPWDELIAYYAELVGVPVPEKKRSILSSMFRMHKKDEQMLYNFSFFGSHFPSDKLKEITSFTPPYDWKEGVASGVKGLLKN